jgi:Ion channel
MKRPSARIMWRGFLVALGRAFLVTWPVLLAILVIQLGLGLLIGLLEGWTIGEAVYFSFITGLTIGYGDIVPRQAITRALAIGIGLCGVLLTGLVAAIAVSALRTTLTDGHTR